jgi:RNA polymerase sigma-70 factor, ECF subfamily
MNFTRMRDHMNRPQSPFVRPQAGGELDAELNEALRGCARHNMPALRRIHDLMAPRLLGELLQMLGDRGLAEAALVDCLVEIWQQAGDYNPQRSQPRAWLLAVARHHAIGLLRKTQTQLSEEVDSTLRFMHTALEEEGSAPERRLLQLAWRTGRSPAEIARALQWPLRRVLQGIRQGLAAMHEASP